LLREINLLALIKMIKLYQIYFATFPWILFLNFFSFGNAGFGIGSMLFLGINVTLFVLSLKGILNDPVNLRAILAIGIIIFIGAFNNILRNEHAVTFAGIYASVATWLLIIINLLIATYYKNRADIFKVVKSIHISLLLGSILGVIHYYFFYDTPFIDMKFDTDQYGGVKYLADADLGRFRETSIYFGANVNAYMSVLGYLCSIFANYKGDIRKVFISRSFWFAAVFHIWNIVVADSRSGMILILLVTLMVIFDKELSLRQTNKLLLRITVGILVIAGALIYITFQNRFSSGNISEEGRVIKLIVGLSIILESNLNLILGLPIGMEWGKGGILVSDNMYLLFIMSAGIVGTGAFLFLLFNTVRKIKKFARKLMNVDTNNILIKYYIYLILIAGLFSNMIGMVPEMIYLGIFIGFVKKNHANIGT
jgi:hypothetical protein